MTDLAATIEPKSDQLNADDLIGGPMTIRITAVKGSQTKEQPIDIHFDGDNGKPYKPCKSMRRVLVQLWGRDGANYIGRSMTLYRDDHVRFGGVEVGGIRISHMSDIAQETTLALTASKTSRKPFTVKPLKGAKPADNLETRRTAMLKHFGDMNVSTERICAAVGKATVTDIGEPEIAKLKALATEIKAGSKSLIEAFPNVVTDRTDLPLEPPDTDAEAERAAIQAEA